jgi:Raf kinase inhibitor-like YbhB/YbcL family protein
LAVRRDDQDQVRCVLNERLQKLPAMTRVVGCCGPLTRAHQTGNRPLIWVAVAAAALAGCGSGGGKSPSALRVERTVRLTSADFSPGGRLPRDETCDGAGRTPSLEIAGAPPAAKALALIVHDPDAPAGDFTHWTVYDIPATARSPSGTDGQNELGKTGYAPACPPKGDKPHHYVFDLYALRARTGLQAGARPDAVRAAVNRLAIARGELVAVYGR